MPSSAKSTKGGGFNIVSLMLGSGANSIGFTVIAGAPVSGTSGTWANSQFGLPGSLLVSLNDNKLYINTNTQASPTWTKVGTQT